MQFLRLFFCLSLLAGLVSTRAESAADNTALGAVRLLPKEAGANLARIEAQDLKGGPERWHLLVYDPAAANGLHEYVVAGGEIVASRSVSQFAESLTAEDVFGDEIKIDSDKVARTGQQYALANKVSVAELAFQLKRDGAEAAPIWMLTCYDAAGNDVGHIAMTATKGVIVSHDGFLKEPADKPERAEKILEKEEKAEKPKSSKPTTTEPTPAKPSAADKPTAKPPAADNDPLGKPEAAKTEGVKLESFRPKKPEQRVLKATPVESTPAPRSGFFNRAGGTLQNIFKGKSKTKDERSEKAKED